MAVVSPSQAGPSGRGSVGARLLAWSQTRLKVAPVARPAGFHHVAVASSATATNAPPIPCARVPTSSYICAAAGDAHTTTATTAVRPRTKFLMLTSIGRGGTNLVI